MEIHMFDLKSVLKFKLDEQPYFGQNPIYGQILDSLHSVRLSKHNKFLDVFGINGDIIRLANDRICKGFYWRFPIKRRSMQKVEKEGIFGGLEGCIAFG